MMIDHSSQAAQYEEENKCMRKATPNPAQAH